MSWYRAVAWRLLLAFALAVGLCGAPTATHADFCGGTMTITPSHGPVGTRFRIEFSVGGRTTVTFIHRGATWAHWLGDDGWVVGDLTGTTE